jgi:hypothetical protein
MLFIQHYRADQFEENEMGEACSMHGKGGKCTNNFSRRSLKGSDDGAL